MKPAFLGLSVCVVVLGTGCTHSVIPNTDLEDNEANRRVVSFVERYRHALELRNPGALLALASRSYYDDNGTPQGDDDVDYSGLERMLSQFKESVLDVRYEIRYRRVRFERERVLVDYTYTGSFRVATPDGDHWTRRLADNRLVLTREGDQYRVLSGM